MIDRPTVLVLGAGASIPYAFPSGSDLVSKAYRLHRGDDDNRLVSRATAFTPEGVEEFARALQLSGCGSIDAFLEGRPEMIEVGKAAIAALLIPCERPDNLFNIPAKDWYAQLLARMGNTSAEFSRNSLSIITFNYDRSLEYFLITSLTNRFGCARADAIELLRPLRIVHLHGQLGGVEGWGASTTGDRPYGPETSLETVTIAAAGIKVIHEDLSQYPQFEIAHKLLREAEDVFFLGFGYNPTNLYRLLVTSGRTGKPAVRGTSRGMEQAETAMASAYIAEASGSTISLELFDVDALTFVRRHWITKLVPRVTVSAVGKA